MPSKQGCPFLSLIATRLPQVHRWPALHEDALAAKTGTFASEASQGRGSACRWARETGSGEQSGRFGRSGQPTPQSWEAPLAHTPCINIMAPLCSSPSTIVQSRPPRNLEECAHTWALQPAQRGPWSCSKGGLEICCQAGCKSQPPVGGTCHTNVYLARVQHGTRTTRGAADLAAWWRRRRRVGHGRGSC